MRDEMSSRWACGRDEQPSQYNHVALGIALALAAWVGVLAIVIVLVP